MAGFTLNAFESKICECFPAFIYIIDVMLIARVLYSCFVNNNNMQWYSKNFFSLQNLPAIQKKIKIKIKGFTRIMLIIFQCLPLYCGNLPFQYCQMNELFHILL